MSVTTSKSVLFLAVTVMLAACGPGPETSTPDGVTPANGGGGGAPLSGGGGGGGSGGPTSCRGDFSIRETVYSGRLAWGACDANPPTNCSGGRYIVFTDGTCRCASPCTTVGVSCDTQGVTVCAEVLATNGNFAKLCTHPSDNLCRKASDTGGGTGGGSGGSGGSSGGGSSCRAETAACSEDADCCSSWCSFGACT